MATPSASTVLGDFAGAIFEGEQIWARFLTEDGAYWIETRSAAGPLERHRVRYTFGIRPLQQYLLEAPGGRLQAFGIAWDTERGRWFDVLSNRAEDLGWAGRYQRWNSMCAECHSTGVRKRYDPDADRYATRFEDVDVGCQSCHGPGARHVRWARDPQGGDSGLEVRLGARAQDELDSCAPCHSRRSRVSAEPIPGAAFLDQYRPQALRAGLYFADGQIEDEVFVYGSFLQSRMHQQGVRCTDCHDPHSQRLHASDNRLCTRCHGEAPPRDRFETLRAKDYDSPEHHHHPPGEGARCVACHMPARTYMQVDDRRDHSFRVPRPDLSVAIGVPNACNQSCHGDKSDQWAQGHVRAWYPEGRGEHFGVTFDRARRGQDVSIALVRIVADVSRPAIVRATALELLRAHPRACLHAARAARVDPSALVREAAYACGESLEPSARARWAAAGLSDERRLVRLEAARLLAGPPASQLEPEAAAGFRRARAELVQRHEAELDLPDGPFNLGVLAEAEGDLDAARGRYRRALVLDPAFVPAAMNLASLELRTKGCGPAEHALLAALRAVPEDPTLHRGLAALRTGACQKPGPPPRTPE